ncbi:hypothetical protein E2C01_023594 [Portunus trituberculatus]|uniref:Uncharacterized protein n=1 Tax=Portunus trituberculatus TaxID=210409 RepID=A0A5B7EBJ5_PORTR|nr:hypothetical protein [Portunus trituberculatus]
MLYGVLLLGQVSAFTCPAEHHKPEIVSQRRKEFCNDQRCTTKRSDKIKLAFSKCQAGASPSRPAAADVAPVSPLNACPPLRLKWKEDFALCGGDKSYLLQKPTKLMTRVNNQVFPPSVNHGADTTIR